MKFTPIITTAQVEKFQQELKDYIEGSGCKLVLEDEVFEFKHRSCLFANDMMVPSKMLVNKLTSLIETHFPGCKPRFNNAKNSFWLITDEQDPRLPKFEL